MPDFNLQVVPVTPFQQNCSLAWSEASRRGIVVDPGGDIDLIRAAIEKVGMTVDFILLTHGHIDHAGAAADLKDELEVDIVGPHEADGPLLARLSAQARQYGLDGVRDVVPDRFLSEGETVDIAGASFDVLHVPGHSPGSVVLHAPSLGFAFMGDVLFQNSIGRTDLPGGSHELLIRGIKEKVLPLGDEVSFLPGHGAGSTIGQERLNNPFLR